MKPYLLLVDDDVDICYTYKMILEMEGFKVQTASNGIEALEILKCGDEAPQLILLDLMMPEMNGWGFRSMQLQDPSLAEIPVIVLSGATELAKHAEELKLKVYLAKPIEIPTLLDQVKKYCPEPINQLAI